MRNRVYSFLSVPRILFGPGTRDRIAEEARGLGSRLFVLASRTMLERGNLRSILDQLRDRFDRIEVRGSPEGEPTIEYVSRQLESCRLTGCDVVLGIGGGSVLDAAKAVAGLYHEPASVSEVFHESRTPRKGIPFVAVPTTAGTGSEVTPNSVLSDPSRQVKQSIRGKSLRARVVINDPELTMGAPPWIKAASGADALVQAIETFVSRGSNDLTDALALRAFALMARSLAEAVEDKDDLDAHSDMACASMMAGMAFSNARLGAVHGMAHPLGVRYTIPHGVCCAVLLPGVMRFNEPVVADKYLQLSTIIGEPLIPWIEGLFERIGLPRNFAEYEARPSDIPAIAEESLPSGSLKANPREPTSEDLQRILSEVIPGQG